MNTQINWVSAFERLPTKNDADFQGNVWVLGYGHYGNPLVNLKAQSLVQPDQQHLVAWASTGLHLTDELSERPSIRK